MSDFAAYLTVFAFVVAIPAILIPAFMKQRTFETELAEIEKDEDNVPS